MADRIDRERKAVVGHKRHLARKYGLSVWESEELRRVQGNVCAICYERPPTSIDHDHTTSQVRGRLCQPCNLALGGFNDDPERLRRAADYLELPSLLEAVNG